MLINKIKNWGENMPRITYTASISGNRRKHGI
jgi:hypothetical protein